MKLTAIFLVVLSMAGLRCTDAKAQSDGTIPNYGIYIDQIGDNNTITVNQDGGQHRALVVIGKAASSDNNTVSIDQKDIGQKTAAVELPNGINNGINILQQGSGQHNTGIINLTGSANNITVTQDGGGNHQFVLFGQSGSTNNANTVTVDQRGGAGADKQFQLNMNGTNGASVNIQQTNPTQGNTGTMSIQCTSNCGSYSYVRQ